MPPNVPVEWNDLPPEIKRHCIKSLDYKSRCQLRCTSRLEKNLVDSFKVHFQFAAFIFSERKELVLIIVENDDGHTFNKHTVAINPQRSETKVVPMFASLINAAISIEFLYLDNWGEATVSHPAIPNFIKVNNLILRRQHTVKRFIGACDPETIKSITAHSHLEVLDRYLITLDLMNVVPFFNLHFDSDPAIGTHFAHAWERWDVDVGKTLRFSTVYNGVTSHFRRHFQQKIVPSGDRLSVRFAMNNGINHIILFRTSVEHMEGYRKVTYLLTVIPANTKPSQYAEIRNTYNSIGNRFKRYV